ncbi:MAG: metallophosphoesterase family protein [Planctomycetota bacterium]
MTQNTPVAEPSKPPKHRVPAALEAFRADFLQGADRFAIVSDIHGNAEAFELVIDHIHNDLDIQTIVCLGDLVGYGPEPIACVKIARQHCQKILMGNHDEAALQGPLPEFNHIAQRTTWWTWHQIRTKAEWEAADAPETAAMFRQMMNVTTHREAATDEERQETRQFLADQKPEWLSFPFSFVHGSPADPLYEYISMIAATRIFEHWTMESSWMWSFCGHTHRPKIFMPGVEIDPVPMRAYPLNTAPIIWNVGSVGLPRIGSGLAHYVIVDIGSMPPTAMLGVLPVDAKRTAGLIEADPLLDQRAIDRVQRKAKGPDGEMAF